MLKLSRRQTAKPKKRKASVKTSRNNPPPKQLEQLIAWVNLLPDEMKTLGEIEATVHVYPNARLDVDQLILAEVEKLPDELKAFVGTFSDQETMIPFGEIEQPPSDVLNALRRMHTTTHRDVEGRRAVR